MKNKFFAAITSLLLTCVMCGICSVNVASASLASDNMAVYYFTDSAPTLCEDYFGAEYVHNALHDNANVCDALYRRSENQTFFRNGIARVGIGARFDFNRTV